jgi:hypothetical protein
LKDLRLPPLLLNFSDIGKESGAPSNPYCQVARV